MNTNAIEKIRNAEANAELIEKEASESALKAVEQAKADAAGMVEKAKLDGEAKVEKAVDDAKSKADAAGDESRKKLEKVLGMLEATANQKQASAVELVKKKLISN